MKQRLFISLLCAVVLFVAGCSGEKKPDGMPALHKTKLTFTQGGAPLADAKITLFADNAANTQWTSGGVTDSNGVIQLKTLGKYDGVPEGTYKVTVSKTETEGTAEEVVVSDDVSKKPAASSGGGAKSYYLVDSKHRSAATTELVLEVKSGTANDKAFDLGPAFRELIPVFKD